MRVIGIVIVVVPLVSVTVFLNLQRFRKYRDPAWRPSGPGSHGRDN